MDGMTDDTSTTIAAMAEAASAFLATLTAEQRQAARLPTNDPDRHRWTYLPGDRPGLPVEELTTEQRGRLDDLVRAGSGADEVALGAIEVERARRTLVLGAVPDGDKYWVRIGGEPGAGPWSWRINGHHLAEHVDVRDDRYTVTPHFIGAEPARLPAAAAGLSAGHRLLAPEEDLPRALLAAMDPDRRAVAVPGDVAPDDILTRFDPVADPTVLPGGVARGDLDDEQREIFDRLLRRYLGRAPADYAAACWEEAKAAGLDAMEFTWLGPLEPGPGNGHYYCLRGPTLLIEYDNTQDNANHAHSVWRHLTDDWGGDLLRRHYEDRHR
jgi:Protein of unknown function (DUF3500)